MHIPTLLFFIGLLGLSLTVSADEGVPGYLLHDLWANVSGTEISDFVEREEFRESPDLTELVLGAEHSVDLDEYGSRYRGTLVAPVTGSYIFWESGDDSVELWISSDERKFGRRLIAWHSGNTGVQNWERFLTQQSAPISLVAGENYYIEVLHKEGVGGDYMALAWSYEADDLINFAREPGVFATQSTTSNGGVASRAIDGDTNGNWYDGSVTHTETSGSNPWWELDLGVDQAVERIVIHNRSGPPAPRLSNFRVSVLNSNDVELVGQNYHTEDGYVDGSMVWDLGTAYHARKIRVAIMGKNLNGDGALHLAEVEVMGSASGAGSATPLGYLTDWTQETGVSASQSSTVAGGVAARAIDRDTNGVYGGRSVTYTNPSNPNTWWQVDLGDERPIYRITLFNRTDNWMERLSNFKIVLLDEANQEVFSKEFFTESGHVGYQLKWDLPAEMQARKVRVERLGPSRSGDYALHLAEVQVLGAQDLLPGAILPREVIPVGALKSFTYDLNDKDDDGLLDDWEVSFGFDPQTWQSGNFGYSSDPDKDYLTNALESELGLNPHIQNSVQGFLTLEQRYGIEFYSISEAAVNSDKIYEPADEVFLVRGSTAGVVQAGDFSQRMRGFIEAPETGMYRFWVSATNGARLLLSSGEDKYSKRLVAEVGLELGTTSGVSYYGANKWDRFASQMSEEIYLEEGQKYFLELLHQHGHGSGAHADFVWARPGGNREEIPTEYLHSYYFTYGDFDDDSLLDEWEEEYGLDLNDNGLVDRIRQGEYGDFDRDGLTNREEYLLGTNPSDSDTDGDGLADGQEVQAYRSDPLSSDMINEELVDVVLVAQPVTSSSPWIASEEGFRLEAHRGSVEWEFTVPEDGYWVISVLSELKGNVRLSESLPLETFIDGVSISRQDLLFNKGVPSMSRVYTQRLSAGAHRIKIFIDNMAARRRLDVHSVEVFKPGGVDLDHDGTPDLLERIIGERSYVESHQTYSYISPFFIEGAAINPELVDLTVIARSGEFDRAQRYPESQWQWMLPGFEQRLSSYQNNLLASLRSPWSWGRMEGEYAPHDFGAGRDRWFSYLDLARNEAIGYVAIFDGLGHVEHRKVVWTPYNVLNGGNMTIPVGSKLLLGAWAQDWDWATVNMTIEGQSVSFSAGDTHVHEFGETGVFQISASHPSGQNTLTVTVVSAELGETFYAAEQAVIDWSLPGVRVEQLLEANFGVSFGLHAAAQPEGSSVSVNPHSPGLHRIVVRQEEGGPILDVGEVNVTGVSDALRNDDDMSIGVDDSMVKIRTTLTLTGLPPEGFARVTIFRAGVLFTDGTTVKEFYAEDLDQDGNVQVIFLFPQGETGGYCHYLEVFDAEENLISTR